MNELYITINKQLEALSDGIDFEMTILANASALLFHNLDRLNWAGFYLMHDGLLKLGPFQGEVACVCIPVGKGVCGTAVAEDRIQRVEDVHQFPGHIACDAKSNSEIVIPIHVGNRIYGVLDIDSPVLCRFQPEDQEGLVEFVRILERVLAEMQSY